MLGLSLMLGRRVPSELVQLKLTRRSCVIHPAGAGLASIPRVRDAADVGGKLRGKEHHKEPYGSIRRMK
jgi:hypothetical protein